MARGDEPGAHGVEVVDDESGVRLAGRSERLLDPDVQLLSACREPDTPACAKRLGLRQLRHAEQLAVERARRVLAPARRGDLDVIDAEDCHRG